MKAIDLQNCGLGDTAGQAWLDLLKAPDICEKIPKCEKSESEEHYGNRTLGIVDLRNNKNLDRNLLRAVTERVLKNACGKHLEFNWLQLRNESVNDGQVTDWPGMEGVVRKDLDTPAAPQRVSTTNPDYQPKYFPPPRQIHRPSFKPAGGSLARTRSLPRTNKPQSSLRRTKLRKVQSSGFLSQDSSQETQERSPTSAKFNGDDNSQSSLVSFDDTTDSPVIRGVPWRTAARAKGRSLRKAYKEPTVKIPQNLVNTLVEKHLVSVKRPKMIDRSISNSVTSRRKSLRSSGKGSSRIGRTASSSPVFPQIRSNRTSPEGRLRRQLQKHMMLVSRLQLNLLKERQKNKLQDHPNYSYHNDYALQDLYNRLNGTLAHVEKVINKIEDSHRSKINRSEADQLILIQSALRDLITPMRRQLDSDKAGQVFSTKSSKTSSRTSYSSLRRMKSKTSSYSRKFESTESTRTVENKIQSCRKRDSQTPPNESAKSSVNSATTKDDNHSNDTSLEEFFLAKPGRAFHFNQQPSAETSSVTYNAQSLPKATFSISPVTIKRMANSAPSLVKYRSKGRSETQTKCVDLFEDVGPPEDADGSELAAKTNSISKIHHCSALEDERLFLDY
nr:centrosomal protein of 78 kda [Hymenolepis microstoma]